MAWEEKKMKYRTTKKAINSSFKTKICVTYCGLQYLLECEQPMAYTTRKEGWGADIYMVNPNVVIVTGYAPFGNVMPSRELREKYENLSLIHI